MAIINRDCSVLGYFGMDITGFFWCISVPIVAVIAFLCITFEAVYEDRQQNKWAELGCDQVIEDFTNMYTHLYTFDNKMEENHYYY